MKKINSEALSDRYTDSEIFKKFAKTLICLAFIPIKFVRETYNWLKNHHQFLNELKSVYDYFFKVYIGYENEAEVLFPIRYWNSHSNTLLNYPRTNNAIEGWNNSFRTSFGCLDKTPRNFVFILRKEEEASRQKLLRLKSGEKLKERGST